MASRYHRLISSLPMVGLILFLSSMAVAAPAVRSVSFTYVRGTTAAECPDERAIRDGVAARLGYEPFQDDASTRISAIISRAGRTLEARIQVADAGGTITAERKLTSQRNDCSELTSAMELALSIAIDPLAGRRPRPPAEERTAAPAPAPPPVPPPASVRRPAPPPSPKVDETRRPTVPLVIGASAGGVGAFRSAPATAVGATVQATLRRGSLSLGLEGRADLPATAPLRIGEMRTSLLTASLVPCWHARVFAACILAAGGAMRASGQDLVDARNVTLSYVGVGARVAIELPASGPLFLRLHGDVLAPLTETVLKVSGEPVWTSPALSAALGIALGARFL